MKLSYKELELKLQETEKQLEDVLKNTQIKNIQHDFEELFTIFNGFEGAAHVIDMNTYEILAANKYSKNLFGNDLIGKTCYKCFNIDADAPCESCKNSHLIDSNGNVLPPLVYEYINPVNHRWFQCTDKAIIWTDGILVKMEIAIDIHDWKLVSDALIISEEKYRKLIAQLPDVVVVHKRSQLLFISEQMFKITGRSSHDYKNMSIFDFIHPDDRNKVIEYSTKREKGEPVPDKYEARIKGPGDEYHFFEIRGTMIDYEGEHATLTVLTSINERKRAEEALLENKDRLRKIIDQNPISMAIVGMDGTIEYINWMAIETFGYSPEDIPTMEQWWLLAYPDETYRNESQKLWMEKVMKGIEQNSVIERGEYNITCKDGTQKNVTVFGIVVTGKIFVMFDNNTNRKQYEIKLTKQNFELIQAKEKAEESDRLKSAFLANMSHEIRTPLNGILGFTDILTDDSITTEKRKEFLKIINMNGKQLLAIINDIIDISKIEAGQVKIAKTKCFLNQFMYEIFTFFNAEIQSKCKNMVDLNLSIPEERSILVYIDDIRVRQVLHNLLGNAMKFTRKGKIEFGYTVDPENYIITFFVNDTGIGLSDEKIHVIFERFRQADDTTTRNYGGTGLGLAISKGLVELMGGKIWAVSQEKIGSTFSFTIPFNPVIVNDTIIEPEKQKIKSSYNWSGKTILVVEDDNDSYLYLETLLEKNNATIIHAENGKEGVDLCKNNHQISLVLMDIQTPVMNGYEATKLIRKFNNELPIIAQTANAFAEDHEKCIHAGCNNYIVKPIEVHSLFALIDKYLERHL